MKIMGFNLTWEDVFDCKINYGHIDNIVAKVYGTGYEYFIWNDRIYKLVGNNDYKPTEYLKEDLN